MYIFSITIRTIALPLSALKIEKCYNHYEFIVFLMVIVFIMRSIKSLVFGLKCMYDV